MKEYVKWRCQSFIFEGNLLTRLGHFYIFKREGGSFPQLLFRNYNKKSWTIFGYCFLHRIVFNGGRKFNTQCLKRRNALPSGYDADQRCKPFHAKNEVVVWWCGICLSYHYLIHTLSCFVFFKNESVECFFVLVFVPSIFIILYSWSNYPSIYAFAFLKKVSSACCEFFHATSVCIVVSIPHKSSSGG